MISLVIFGSRECWPSNDEIEQGLIDLGLNTKFGPNQVNLVVCGMAPGADACGRSWAQDHNIKVIPFYAKWNELGKAAGPERNMRMAVFATHGIGFWYNDSRGTANMAAHLLLRNKPVRLYECRTIVADSSSDDEH